MSKRREYSNLILAILAGIVLWGLLALIFEFYYDLNDDVLIKDILSGAYTGRPDAHNNQMMYPLSVLLAGLYKITDEVPWFGVFEIACYFVSFVIIAFRIMGMINGLLKKSVYLLLQMVFWLGTYLWELTMIQYTVTCGILCTAASVWVYSSKDSKSIKAFIIDNVPAIILVVIAFNIRSEMFLLMCPFMAIVGLARWLREVFKLRKDTDKEKADFVLIIKKYSYLLGIIIVCLIVTFIIDTLAYSRSDWKEYRDFFNARTEVYDFTGIPDYEANEDFYKNEGISYDSYQLLIDYNFALDSDIKADTLLKIADYVKSGNAKNKDGSPYIRLNKKLKTVIGEYIRGALQFTLDASYDLNSPFADDASQLIPLNMIVILLYITIVMVTYFNKNYMYLLFVPVMLILRSVSWIYIYYKGRMVSRISHPMFMIEITILTAMIVRGVWISEAGKSKGYVQDRKSAHTSFRQDFSTKGYAYLAAILTFAICILNGFNLGKQILVKQALRDDINYDVKLLNEYTLDHEGYYLIDTYSTVDFTEKIFGEDIIDKSNQQLAGGWMANSPLDEEKAGAYAEIYFAELVDGKWEYERSGMEVEYEKD